MSVSSIVLKLVIPALALISVGLQFSSLNAGCDIFRIHFKALNDNDIYFNNDPWVGLGLSYHQTFLGKNTQFWNHDSTCVKYDELEFEMFKEGNLSSIESLNKAGMVITMIAAIFAIVRACCFVTRAQLPSEKVKECSLGKDGGKIKAAIALNGIIVFMATAIALFNLASILKSTTNTDYVENSMKETLSRNNGSSLRSMRQNDDDDDATVSTDYPTDVEDN
ncbi:predicted protein [Chaetoceros tenuissimus]|uniref:Uncharacterized protein n=1 Tax=Chaetoceros tenuissimus TaxID=426638 RepID=A0AAD3DDF3_9STRA|nr:predicted protein [Chaetoceros tenuissimus]